MSKIVMIMFVQTLISHDEIEYRENLIESITYVVKFKGQWSKSFKIMLVRAITSPWIYRCYMLLAKNYIDKARKNHIWQRSKVKLGQNYICPGNTKDLYDVLRLYIVGLSATYY